MYKGDPFFKKVLKIFLPTHISLYIHEKQLNLKFWAILTIFEHAHLHLKFAKIVIFHQNAPFPAYI